jgi:hypothetical protein
MSNLENVQYFMRNISLVASHRLPDQEQRSVETVTAKLLEPLCRHRNMSNHSIDVIAAQTLFLVQTFNQLHSCNKTSMYMTAGPDWTLADPEAEEDEEIHVGEYSKRRSQLRQIFQPKVRIAYSLYIKHRFNE